VVQYGGKGSVFTVVMDDAKVIAWAQYEIEPLPYIGTVTLKHIYNEGANKEAVDLLCDELIQFGLKNRCTQIMSHSPNRKVQNHFAGILTKREFVLEPLKRFHWMARKV